nr:hypothetical protein Iba_chr08cCG8120 [Ipomoea batatas]
MFSLFLARQGSSDRAGISGRFIRSTVVAVWKLSDKRSYSSSSDNGAPCSPFSWRGKAAAIGLESPVDLHFQNRAQQGDALVDLMETVKEREGWSIITIHDLSGSPVAQASIVKGLRKEELAMD